MHHYFSVLIVLFSAKIVSSVSHERLRNLRSNSWNNDLTTWTPASLDCSSLPPVNNTYCDRMIDSLLVLVVGFPPGDVVQSSSTAARTTTEHYSPPTSTSSPSQSSVSDNSTPKFYSPTQEPVVTKICCFLLSFPDVRDVCCKQVASFCEGVPGQRDACVCQGSSSGNQGSRGGMTGISIHGIGLPDTETGDGEGDGDSDGGGNKFNMSNFMKNAYNILKKIGGEIIDNFMNNKK